MRVPSVPRERVLDPPRLRHRHALGEHRPDRRLERRAEADRAPAARLRQQPPDHRVARADLRQPAPVDVQRQHPRGVALDPLRRQVGDEVDLDLPRLLDPHRAQRDRVPAVVGQRDTSGAGSENGPRGRSEIVTRGG